MLKFTDVEKVNAAREIESGFIAMEGVVQPEVARKMACNFVGRELAELPKQCRLD